MKESNLPVRVRAMGASTYRTVFCAILGIMAMWLLGKPGTAHSQVLGVSGGGTGASTLSGYLYGNGTSPITGSSSIPASASSFTQLGTGALTRDLDAKTKENALSLLDFCSDNTGVTDCAAAIADWEAEGIALQKALYIPAGIYRSASQQVWNLHAIASKGINVFGDGRTASVIKFDAGVAYPNWEIVGNDTAGESIDYSRFEDFEVVGSTSGALMQFGRDDFNDAMNEFQLNNLLIWNQSTAGTAVALKLNYFLNGLVNVDANGGGFDTGTNTGSGYAALYCNQCLMNTFMGSYGIDGNGIYLSQGFNVTNTFLNTDTEANTSDIRIDSANAVSNTWVGGQISLATYGINATNGSGNIFINVNNAITGAGTTFMPNAVGVWLETPNYNHVSTPSVPASGTAYSNTTGQVVEVTMNAGSVSYVQRNGVGLFTHSDVTVILEPGDTITLTYTSAPGWIWMPIRG
ncbi:MAG TPA: hypothetical protein VGR92_04540 [Steroidobacteraceae bacterium]|nr:hypothetical protein [Steroidobacteraceae bacterium]